MQNATPTHWKELKSSPNKLKVTLLNSYGRNNSICWKLEVQKISLWRIFLIHFLACSDWQALETKNLIGFQVNYMNNLFNLITQKWKPRPLDKFLGTRPAVNNWLS